MADTEQTEASRLQELVRRCEVSRHQRRVICELLRQAYERGTDSGPRARYNKLQSHLDRVGSYLFAPGTIRFGVHLPVALRKLWLPAGEVARDEFRNVWDDSGADLIASQLIEWALVYGSTVAKVQRDPATGFRVGYIQPWDFGVSREDVPQMDEQDVLAHWYTLSVPQIERWLRGHPREESLLAIAREHEHRGTSSTARQGLVLAGISGVFPGGSIQGGFPGEPDLTADLPAPTVDEPIVAFVDLWERRLFRRRLAGTRKPVVFEDWLVTTLIADKEVIFTTRRNPDLPWTRTGPEIVFPAEVPFVAVVPRPLPDFFWGRSELNNLRQLQKDREELFADMREIIKRQLDPSKFFSGVPDFEEAGRALSSPGGAYGTPEPAGKMETIKVEIGQAPFTLLQQYDAAFAEASGVPEVLEKAEMPGGVRATGQMTMLAGIGGGRIRRTALMIEDPLGQIATKGFHILQRHDDQPYALEDGSHFLLSQLPPSMRFRVNSHSSSPIYAEQAQAKGTLLSSRGAIGSDDLVEMVQPDNVDELKAKAKKRDESKAELQKEMLKIQAEKARAKPAPRR